MNQNSFYQSEFTISERDRKLADLAAKYHRQCEAYDRIVCTGPIVEGSIMAATNRELRLINRNAIITRECLFRDKSYTPQEIQRAIAKAAP